MSPVQKSFISAGAILLGAAAVVGGVTIRDKSDLHIQGGKVASYDSRHLLASRFNDSPTISEGDFFDQMVDLLKHEYVDPVTDDSKLTSGAIRGMVLSLENPDCLFMDPKEYTAYTNSHSGKYEGIGVDLSLEIPPNGAKASPSSSEPLASDSPIGTRIPALVVASVVPGGPADKAGVKVGDSVDSIDGHWVVNPYTLETFRQLQKDVAAGKQTQDKLIAMRRDIRKKIDDSMMPLKAKDQLTLGTSGTVKVGFDRAGNIVQTVMLKGLSAEPALAKEPDGAVQVHFYPGVSEKFKSELDNGTKTFDLRNNAIGDYAQMKRCLALVAPGGTYGQVVTLKGGVAKPLQIVSSATSHNLTLIVDGSTKGYAEIFALALQTRGLATLKGGPMSPNRNLIEDVGLPDGSGYTLVTGKYQPVVKGGAA
jgi:carboxyl-terminal processing protease